MRTAALFIILISSQKVAIAISAFRTHERVASTLCPAIATFQASRALTTAFQPSVSKSPLYQAVTLGNDPLYVHSMYVGRILQVRNMRLVSGEARDVMQ